ncbi:hypothetical protein PUMCH_002099 [Australozyma saopauloensis]|uniref:Peptidase S8/S53 domain-containing protein n=1 Tax=Australozyma saopauloensis TaxID=291208 RepID=A0AAX4H8K5_9ASCO|nr:hypothetical protein PUMCH_002099 [[Candida] saopauloensis]
MIWQRFLPCILFAAKAMSYAPEELAEAAPMNFEVPENRYIVEFETSFADAQDDLGNQNLQFSVSNHYESSAFLGMSIQIHNPNEFSLDDVLSLPSVRNVWQASYVTLDFKSDKSASPQWSPHSITGVDTVHDKAIFGEGIRVAVVDSGLDIHHEAFQHLKIEGYDFTADPQNPQTTFEDSVGHGTFVSSIIVGLSNDMKGVAPGASLKMYKVFGKSATTTDDIILAALLKAYSESPDVISLSLGSDRGYPSMPISIVASRIAETIPVVFAAGNSGRKGPFHASSGASGNGVIAVASVESTQHASWSATLKSSSGEKLTFDYIGNDGSKIATDFVFEVEYIGNACAIPASFDSNAGKIVMGIRGTCKNSEIENAIRSNHYSGSIMFVSPGEMHTPKFESHDKIFGLTTNSVRSWLKRELNDNNEISISFAQEDTHGAIAKIDGSAGQISAFTSWGPTFHQDFYPHIAAPGGNVFGAHLGGGYSISSGTSFACPYIAGVIALYLSEHGRVEPQTLRRKIINSGSLLSRAYSSGYIDYIKTKTDLSKYAPLIQQGNGLVNVESMWNLTTNILSEPYFLLNDTDNRISSFKISFANESPEQVTYRIRHREMDVVNTCDSTKRYVSSYWPEFVDSRPQVEILETSLVLEAGSKGSVSVQVRAPLTIDKAKAPVFQGVIEIMGSNGDEFTVPFIGSEFSAKEWTPITQQPLLLIRDKSGLRKIAEEEKLSFEPLRTPSLFYSIRYASELYSVDLVEELFDVAQIQLPLLSSTKNYLGPIRAFAPQSGSSIAFPIVFSPISAGPTFVQPQSFSNGTAIPSGRYKFLCRALKIFGKPSNINDWQFFLTDSFTVALSQSENHQFATGRMIKGKNNFRFKRDEETPLLSAEQFLVEAEIEERAARKSNNVLRLRRSLTSISGALSGFTNDIQFSNDASSSKPYALLSLLMYVLTWTF